MDGLLTRASDIYSLGLIFWEVLAGGQHVFQDTPALQVFALVTQKRWRPHVPPNCPPPLTELMQRCWAESPQDRYGTAR